MVLADGEEVDPDLFGQDALLHYIANRLSVRQRLAVGRVGAVPESIEPEHSGNAVSLPPAANEFVGWSVMSGAPPVVLFGEAEGPLLLGETVNRTLEVLALQHCAEHWTTGLQYPAGAERSKRCWSPSGCGCHRPG
jgi:hypothetical protein